VQRLTVPFVTRRNGTYRRRSVLRVLNVESEYPAKPSGTTNLTFSNSTFCPHSAFMCFVWISEQTAIISLYSINCPVCVTETECVYCAVRTILQIRCKLCSSLYSAKSNGTAPACACKERLSCEIWPADGSNNRQCLPQSRQFTANL
jgi:hypothetical protein